MTNLPVSRDVNDLVTQLSAVDMPGLNDDERSAQETHNRFIAAVHVGKSAAYIVREQAVKMYVTKGYLSLKIPYLNDPTTFITFNDHRQWMSYAAEVAELSDATESALSTFCEYVIDPVSKGLVPGPDGTPYTVEDVLNLREGHQQKLASGARNLDRNQDISEDNRLEQLGELINAAKTLYIDEFVEALRTAQLSTRRNPTYDVEVARVNNNTVYMVVVPSSQEPMVTAAFDGRANFATKAIDDLVSKLMNYQLTQQQVEDATPDKELANYFESLGHINDEESETLEL